MKETALGGIHFQGRQVRVHGHPLRIFCTTEKTKFRVKGTYFLPCGGCWGIFFKNVPGVPLTGFVGCHEMKYLIQLTSFWEYHYFDTDRCSSIILHLSYMSSFRSILGMVTRHMRITNFSAYPYYLSTNRVFVNNLAAKLHVIISLCSGNGYTTYVGASIKTETGCATPSGNTVTKNFWRENMQ